MKRIAILIALAAAPAWADVYVKATSPGAVVIAQAEVSVTFTLKLPVAVPACAAGIAAKREARASTDARRLFIFDSVRKCCGRVLR